MVQRVAEATEMPASNAAATSAMDVCFFMTISVFGKTAPQKTNAPRGRDVSLKIGHGAGSNAARQAVADVLTNSFF